MQIALIEIQDSDPVRFCLFVIIHYHHIILLSLIHWRKNYFR